MIAEACYLDSSALRQLYVHDAHSAAMAAWRFKNPGTISITRFGRTELVNALAGAVFRQEITEVEFYAVIRAFESDVTERRVAIEDISWRSVLERAEELSRIHSPRLGTRTLDVLHVASALELRARRLVTYDERQAALGKLCGLKIVAP